MSGIEEYAGIPRKGARQKRLSLKIDMTPMVDLGFLLISFFVITTQLTQPKSMDLIVPAEGKSMPVENSNALTVIVDVERIVAYEGQWDAALKNDMIISLSTPYGLRELIQKKQLKLENSGLKEGKEGLMIIVKPTQSSRYADLVDVLDEILIGDVKKYALDKPSDEEITWLKK
jgi:biopolymer transport protein ExbD